jgi:alkylation response protein AidB-like acyl-CoA dehydrogenase
MTALPNPQLSEIVRSLGPSFRERAGACDTAGSFVAENYQDLKRHKLLSVGVPRDLGGGGASHSELCHMLRDLAQYCGSTALALSMHTHLLAAAVFRHLKGQPGEALLRKVAGAELVLVSTGAGDWVDSVGHAERAPGGYRVSATKRFCSGSPLGDILITSAPFADPERGTSEVLHFPVPLSAAGVKRLEDWDTLGMRGTGSNSIELEAVFVPEEAIAARRPSGQWHPLWNVVVTVAAPIYMAPYVGIAERAAALTLELVGKRPQESALFQSLGELENLLATAQMAWREMVAITNDYDVAPTPDHVSRMLVRKTIAANAAKASVAKAMEVVGGSAYFRRLGLERLFRDVQGASFHPLPEKKQTELTGRVKLGLSPTA